jgi:hypothetical protein
MQSVNLVVSCTHRKKTPVPAPLQARALRSMSLPDRLYEWIERRNTYAAREHQAVDLYAGDHWQVAQSVVHVASDVGLDVNLFVCSAGYGLIRASTPIKPYSFTFTTRHVDAAVSSDNTNNKFSMLWWSGLCTHSPLSAPTRGVAGLAADQPDVPIIIVASESYVSAMAEDLAEAWANLKSRDLLSVLSSGMSTKRTSDLNSCILPTDARFEAVVGGTRAALNVRIARLIFQNLEKGQRPSYSNMRTTIDKIYSELPPLRNISRRKLSDEEIMVFIKKERQYDLSVSKSRLLWKLRSEGAACEQTRFSEIFYRDFRGDRDGSS